MITGYDQQGKPVQVEKGKYYPGISLTPPKLIKTKTSTAEKIVKKFHPDDRAKMIEFVNNTRLKKPENIELEKDARRSEEHTSELQSH